MTAFRIIVLFVLLFPSRVHPASAFYGGISHSVPFASRDFSEPWMDGMGYAAGYERSFGERFSAVFDVTKSRFVPDRGYYSDGGRQIVIGGVASCFTVSGGVKALLSAGKGRVAPFAQGGVGLSRLAIEPLDLVRFFEGMMTSYSGTSETRFALRAGVGLLIRGPSASPVDAQFDYQFFLLPGEPYFLYGTARMLILFRLL